MSVFILVLYGYLIDGCQIIIPLMWTKWRKLVFLLKQMGWMCSAVVSPCIWSPADTSESHIQQIHVLQAEYWFFCGWVDRNFFFTGTSPAEPQVYSPFSSSGFPTSPYPFWYLHRQTLSRFSLPLLSGCHLLWWQPHVPLWAGQLKIFRLCFL